jgi:hypothetical protein
MRRVILGVLCLFTLATFSFSMGFSLKLTGGAASITGGGYNDAVEGTNALNAADYSSVAGTFSKLQFGMNFGAEFIVNINESFGIGLGAGTMQFSRDTETVTGRWSMFGIPFVDTLTLKPSVTSIPVTLNVHYTMPMGGVNLNLFAGVGYYISKMKVDQSFNSTSGTFTAASTYTFDSNSISGQIGFQGGFGIDIPLGGKFSFVADFTGRYVSLSDIQGDYTATASILGFEYLNVTGDDSFFYTYEFNNGGTWFKVLDWVTDTAKPSGTHYRNAAHGNFGLTGVSARAGFKIGF